MAIKPKCSKCNERDVFSKGLCTRCYGHQWYAKKKAEREAVVVGPKLLVADTEAVIEGEVVDTPTPEPIVHLVARNPAEMQAAQSDLKRGLQIKLTDAENEVREMNAAISEARRNKWNDAALVRARNRAVSLETFYFKLLAAVDAGYTIIPDFPVDVFAIRVTRPNVRAESRTQTSQWGWPNIRDEQPDITPAGAGEYRNPSQNVYHTESKDADGKVQRTTMASSFQDEIVFPMIAARPLVMNATTEAMALKVFDQIGVCRPVGQAEHGRSIVTWGKGDPLVIGQILYRRASGLKVVSFIIAWYLDLNTL